MTEEMYNNDIGRLRFEFAGEFLVYVNYEFEDYAHYHDRTGRGHPDAAMREIMQRKKIRPDAT